MGEDGGQEMSHSYGKGLRYSPILRDIMCWNMIFLSLPTDFKKVTGEKKKCMVQRGYALIPQKEQPSFCHLTLIL